MGKLPLQTPREVEANLRSLGFVYKRTNGSHATWVREADGVCQRAIVQVDVAKKQFGPYLMKMMIRQSLLSQDEFCSGVLKKPKVKSTPDLERSLESAIEEEKDA